MQTPNPASRKAKAPVITNARRQTIPLQGRAPNIFFDNTVLRSAWPAELVPTDSLESSKNAPCSFSCVDVLPKSLHEGVQFMNPFMVSPPGKEEQHVPSLRKKIEPDRANKKKLLPNFML